MLRPSGHLTFNLLLVLTKGYIVQATMIDGRSKRFGSIVVLCVRLHVIDSQNTWDLIMSDRKPKQT